MQPSRNNTFDIPASPEVAAYEQQKMIEAALEAATPRHEIDPYDIDQRRVEAKTMGAGTIAIAREIPHSAPGEVYFNPTDIAQLARVAVLVMMIRRAKLAEARGQ